MTSVTETQAHEFSPKARASAKRALELDPELAEAHAALGLVLSMYYWDSHAAERHFQRAIELDPGYAMARHNYATHLRNLGRFEEALDQARMARELDPLSVFPRHEEGVVLFLARRYDEVIALCRALLDDNPNAPLTHLLLAKAYAAQGRYEEALASLQAGDPNKTRAGHLATRGYVFGLINRLDDARQTLHTLESLPHLPAATSFQRSIVHVALGNHERAIALLQQAAEQRTWLIRLLAVEPTFAPLRGEPPFQALLQRMGLSEAGQGVRSGNTGTERG